MKKYTIAILIILLFSGQAFASDKAKDPNRLFYTANALYEKGEYAKAVEAYISILDMGLENGNMFYNIGNGFLKLGKVGYAVLCYERAKRYSPGDSDLKANLAYARLLTGDSDFQTPLKSLVVRIIERPFRNFNLATIAISALIFYVIVFLGLAFIIISPVFSRKGWNPIFLRRIKLALLAMLTALIVNVMAFTIRYYDEEILKHGIVIQKEAECKYEPIEKSTTYYNLHEGNEVLILETRNGWRRIKRLDGKIAWVKKETIEEI